MSRKTTEPGDISTDIDRIDRELIRLVNERAGHAMDAAHSKRSRNGADARLYRPDREAQLLRRVAQLNPGPIANEAMRSIMAEVVSACRAMELPLTVAYLGPSGTYTEAAALKHFGHDKVAPSGDDKTAVMFYWSRDVPGGLYKAIEVFARAGMNMTRIESRPSRLRRWTYTFHVDFVGHRDEDRVRAALAELEERTDFCKVIGSFPRAVAEDSM